MAQVVGAGYDMSAQTGDVATLVKLLRGAVLKELATVGLKPVALMIGETAFPATLALALMRWPR